MAQDFFASLGNFFGSPNIQRAGKYALQDLGYGLAAAPTFGDAFSYAAQNGMQMQDSRREQERYDTAQAKELEQGNQTKAWLESKGYADLVPLVDAGQSTVAYEEAINRMQPDYGRVDAKGLINVGGGQLYDPNSGEWITSPNGNTETPSLTTIYDDNGREQKGYMQGTTFVPVGSPKASTERPEFNVSQATAAGYADRMAQADALLSSPELSTVQTDLGQRTMGGIPVVGNMMTSAEFQQADQAQRDFINAILRRESGAVISDSEFDSARRQYFPQPGDSDAVLNQKAANRRNAINGVARAAGPAYQAPDTTNYLENAPATSQIIDGTRYIQDANGDWYEE